MVPNAFLILAAASNGSSFFRVVPAKLVTHQFSYRFARVLANFCTSCLTREEVIWSGFFRFCSRLDTKLHFAYFLSGFQSQTIFFPSVNFASSFNQKILTLIIVQGASHILRILESHSQVFLVRQLFFRRFSVNYSTVNLLLLYESPDCFFKQSDISAFLYCFDLNQMKLSRRENKKQKSTVKQIDWKPSEK